DPKRMPTGLGLSLLLLAVGFGLFALVAARLPGVSASGLAPQLTVGHAALGATGFWVMLVVTVVTAGTTFNGGFAAASRLVYALGRTGYLPASLGKLSPRFVPARALYLLAGTSAVLTILVFATHRYLILINAGATLESAMYVIAALALLGLRRREANLPRTYRAPGGRIIPVATVVLFGVLGLGAALTPTDLPLPQAPWTLILLAILAVAAYTYTRRVLKRRAASRAPASSM
ncbi:MAG TPA: amino acid permease, partial [Bacillota bacterium]|nr:amino acid permease [Bacillota bacterium]